MKLSKSRNAIICGVVVTLGVAILAVLLFRGHAAGVEKTSLGQKYRLSDGLVLHRFDGENPVYYLSREDEGIVSVELNENGAPEDVHVYLGVEPQLGVEVNWERREIAGITRYMGERIVIDKNGDGIPDIRQFPDVKPIGRELFYDGQWVLVEEDGVVRLPNGKSFSLEFKEGKWQPTTQGDSSP